VNLSARRKNSRTRTVKKPRRCMAEHGPSGFRDCVQRIPER
jgi:hypothetical protein